MNPRRYIFFVPFVLLAIASLVLSSTGTLAQGPQPTTTPKPPLPPFRETEDKYYPGDKEDNRWWSNDYDHLFQASPISPQTTGGPDDFGYTWDDSVALNWIDVSVGTDTGINNSTDHVGPVGIGFSFKYYENIYTQIYISRFGFVAFNENNIYNSQSEIPSAGQPNDVIAPHWVPVDNVNGYVRYLSSGTAPNRWFVVEWNRLESENDEYNFEVILYENGDIVFQYGTMTVDDSHYCQASGIEDSTGLDGLSITSICQKIAPNHAVRIHRPAPSARIRIFPLYHGMFTHAGETVAFQVPIRNTGELGSDTYDLTPSSAWPVSLYAADGTTLLEDTDSDGALDTGSLVQGGTFTVTVKVQTPGGVSVGDDNTATVTARSSLDTSKSKMITMNTAIPYPFAQIYRDSDGAMSLYLAQPGAQAVKKTTSDWYYGYDMAVTEMPSGFAYFWDKSRCLDRNCNDYVCEIEYILLDRYGQTEREVSKLTDHTGATMSTYDFSPAVAVAPNGRIGVLWSRELYNSSEQLNFNVYFAILDSSGNLVYGPVNLTNNTVWGEWSDLNVPSFYNPRIAATGDNRFVLGWGRQSQETPSGSCTSWCWLSDIYYTVRDTNGGAVKEVTKFTNGVAGGVGYTSPALAALSGNRALLTYSGSSGITYAVLDSSGNIVKASTVTGGSGRGPDAVQLSDGNIVIAWTYADKVMFVVLNSATYNVTAGPNTLVNPAAMTGSRNVSITSDAAGHAILTWMDADWDYHRNLYYALVDGNGGVLTSPMIFRTAGLSPWWSAPSIETSYEGYGNTSYSWTPPTEVDLNISSRSSVGAPPGGQASIPIQYQNIGASTAASVTITATIGASLTYVSDTSGVTPIVSGDTLTWTLPGLDFLDTGEFTLIVSVPSSPFGTRYPVSLIISSAGADANLTDNVFDLEVKIARQVFLPLILRNYP